MGGNLSSVLISLPDSGWNSSEDRRQYEQRSVGNTGSYYRLLEAHLLLYFGRIDVFWRLEFHHQGLYCERQGADECCVCTERQCYPWVTSFQTSVATRFVAWSSSNANAIRWVFSVAFYLILTSHNLTMWQRDLPPWALYHQGLYELTSNVRFCSDLEPLSELRDYFQDLGNQTWICPPSCLYTWLQQWSVGLTSIVRCSWLSSSRGWPEFKHADTHWLSLTSTPHSLTLSHKLERQATKWVNILNSLVSRIVGNIYENIWDKVGRSTKYTTKV